MKERKRSHSPHHLAEEEKRLVHARVHHVQLAAEAEEQVGQQRVVVGVGVHHALQPRPRGRQRRLGDGHRGQADPRCSRTAPEGASLRTSGLEASRRASSCSADSVEASQPPSDAATHSNQSGCRRMMTESDQMQTREPARGDSYLSFKQHTAHTLHHNATQRWEVVKSSKQLQRPREQRTVHYK